MTLQTAASAETSVAKVKYVARANVSQTQATEWPIVMDVSSTSIPIQVIPQTADSAETSVG